ncbi:MAG: glycoside hydrolase family 97 catalytic domain-containing protein [Undibacterium sp.]|nr:glycoside hydrolase family 97 catalytic domain-containing protein [Undibacterium sp.]
MKIKSCISLLLIFCAHTVLAAQEISSPDRHIKLKFEIGADHTPRYSVYRDAQAIILSSDLGLQLDGADFKNNLHISAVSAIKNVSDNYAMLVGKRRQNHYVAHQQIVSLVNPLKQKIDIEFQVSNAGVAFRYLVTDPSIKHKKFVQESSSFTFDAATKAWLQPMSVAQTGWMNTNPAYEEHYQMGIPVGTVSPSPAGWVFPALFQRKDVWIVLSEANMDGSFHASRLQAESANGCYKIGAPMAAEIFPGGALMAETDVHLVSPWRIIGIGSLATIMDSNLGNDLAAPAVKMDADFIKPGHASWSWALLKDDSTVFEVQKKFIAYAADMHWDYTLIDADWDRKIGYERMQELVTYAASKKIGLLLWYNSSGSWNKTEYSPKGQLLTREMRRKEFARLQAMGVKGIKVDFFAGDGKSMVDYYMSILNDAADYGLLVNFHGATLPRGWARTYPNLMSMEAVKGLEFTTFAQPDQDAVLTHAAMLPFARNLYDPMDFTPMVFGDIPNIRRVSKNGFELAQSVLFLSGIQHFAEIPEGMATVPSYVKTFLQDLPRSWDDSKFVAGFPGKFVVIARRSGDSWYVAGINAEENEMALDLDLSFIANKAGMLMTDAQVERSFVQKTIAAGKASKISVAPHGGFVAVFK